MQHLARRQDQVEEEVAVVEPALAVAGLRASGHEVELGRTVAAGEGAMVEPYHAHHAVGQAAQRGQGGEGNRAAGHAATRRVIEQRSQRRMHDRERQRGLELGGGDVVGERGDRGAHLAQRVGMLGGVADQAVEHLVEHAAPAGAGVFAQQQVAHAAQAVGIAPQAAEGGRGLALGRGGADAAGEAGLIGGLTGCPGEEQAVQALVERVGRGHAGCGVRPTIGARGGRRRTRNVGGGGGGGIDAGARSGRRGIFRIQPPAHPRRAQPVVYGLQRRLIEPEARRHRRLLQQVEHAARRETAGGQVQGLVEHARHRVVARAAEAGDAPRDAARRRRGAEHSLDQRRGGLQVGRQHHHVGRAQRIVGAGMHLEQAEQAVVQHLEFAGARVADMHLDAAVAGRQAHARGRQLLEVEDGVVQPRQQMAAGM